MKINYKKIGLGAALALPLALAAIDASAGATAGGVTGDTTTFSNGKKTVQSWAIGDLGVAIATIAGILGIAQSMGGKLMNGAMSFGVAFLGAYGPDIITKIYSATI
jgi:hypothetical protein